MPDTRHKNYKHRGEMTETYKRHIIQSGARSVPGSKWKPTVQIYWEENSAPFMKSWMEGHFEKSFPLSRRPKCKATLLPKNGLTTENQIWNHEGAMWR